MNNSDYLRNDSYIFTDVNLYTEIKSNIVSPLHCHDFYEFFYVIEGTIVHTVNKEEEILSIGDLRFIPPNASHSLMNKGPSLHRDIVITKEYFENLCALLGIEKSFFYDNDYSRSWTLSLKQINHIEEAVATFNADDSNNLQRKRCLGLNLVNTIFMFICDLKYNKNELKKTLPFCIQSLIDNINTPDFFINSSIGATIKKMGYTTSYISHVFKRHIGKSISDYVKEKRLLHIEHYLRNTTFSLQEICTSVGLKNLSHLNNIFKEKHGISPIEYRRKTKEQTNIKH